MVFKVDGCFPNWFNNAVGVSQCLIHTFALNLNMCDEIVDELRSGGQCNNNLSIATVFTLSKHFWFQMARNFHQKTALGPRE